MIIAEAPSPNFGPRAHGKEPQLLVLHYTDTKTGFDALKIMQDPEREVSAHYLVDTDGQITRLVPEEMRAWHAGRSNWAGETDINSLSIGIEIQNTGHTYGLAPFPDVQMAAVAELCRDIIMRNKILPYHVLAHSDIAPDRKRDPGELFPWEWLALQGIGLWPQPTETEALDAEDMLGNEDEIKSLLTRFGYNPAHPFKTLVTAFQRRFEQGIFADEELVGTPTVNTVKMAKALVRQRLAMRPRKV